MHIAYVAGPYRDPRGAHYVLENIFRARRVATWLWQIGFAVVCPHLNSALMDGACPDRVFLDGAIEIMRRCDLVVAVTPYNESEGTLVEIAAAQEIGMPVYDWQGEYLKIMEVAEGLRPLPKRSEV